MADICFCFSHVQHAKASFAKYELTELSLRLRAFLRHLSVGSGEFLTLVSSFANLVQWLKVRTKVLGWRSSEAGVCGGSSDLQHLVGLIIEKCMRSFLVLTCTGNHSNASWTAF